MKTSRQRLSSRIRGVITLLHLLITVVSVSAQESLLPPVPATSATSVDILSFGLDVVPSPEGGDFFDGYRSLGPRRNALPALAAPRLAIRVALPGNIRLAFALSYGNFSINDIYGVIDSSARGAADAFGAFVEQFDATFMPVLVGIEYIPVQTQFATYVGAMIGAGPVTVEWKTLTQHESPGFLSRPELNATGVGLEPAARMYVGIDYQFDESMRERGMVRGIFVEGSYLVLPVRRDYFTAVRRQGRGIPTLPSADEATLQLGGVAVTLGLNLQFSRR